MGKKIDIVNPELKQQMCEALGIDWISDKTAQILQLMSKDIAIENAYRLVTGKDNIPRSTKHNIQVKSDKWLLARPEMQKLAHNAVKDTLKMKPIEARKSSESDELIYIYPRVSDRLAAASMVLDRIEPVKGNDAARQITNNIQVNINKYDNPNEITLDIDDMG